MSKGKDWMRAPVPREPLRSCPHCAEQMVEREDHHGSWWAHRNEPARCAHGVTQLHDQQEYDEWNQRGGEELDAVRVTGVLLAREGDYAVVSVEINKKWVPVIRERYDGAFSHIVEPSGIRKAANT